MRRLYAHFRRWKHLLRSMWKGHCGLDAFDHRGRIIVLACSCGRVFWIRGR